MVLAGLAFVALWAHSLALPAPSVRRDILPYAQFSALQRFRRAQHDVGVFPEHAKLARHSSNFWSGRKTVVLGHGRRDLRIRSLPSNPSSGNAASAPKESAENADNLGRVNSLASVFAKVLQFKFFKQLQSLATALATIINQIPQFVKRIDAKRFGWVSRALNIIIVLLGIFTAVWSWVTATPEFVSVLDALLNSRPFLRLHAAWIALPGQNWAAFESFVNDKPWTAAAVITGVAYALADWTAQSCEGRGPFGFSRMRLLRNMLVGATILAPYAHQYYEIQDHLIPGDGLHWAPVKVFLDQSIYAASYNCLFLAGLGLLQFSSPKDIIDNIKEKLPVMMKGSWRFWPFVHCVTYTVIPTTFKLLWVDAVDVIWVTYLSMVANSRRAETTKVIGELIEQQSSGTFLERWRADKALNNLAERVAMVESTTLAGDELPPESERVVVIDDTGPTGRNLTIVQVAEADRAGLMLEIMLSLRRQRVDIVHGIIDTTDSRKSANVFYVREEQTKLPLDEKRRDQLQSRLQNQLYYKFPPEAKEVPRIPSIMEQAEEALASTRIERVEKARDGIMSAPPHAATELLYAIEVDKKTRKEVGQALQAQGLQVPDNWWGEEDKEDKEDENQEKESLAEQSGTNQTANVVEEQSDVATAKTDAEKLISPVVTAKTDAERYQQQKEVIDNTPSPGDAEEAATESPTVVENILTMKVNDTDVSKSLKNIIKEAVEEADEDGDEALSETTTPASILKIEVNRTDVRPFS